MHVKLNFYDKFNFMKKSRCSISGCEKSRIARGFCHTHYKRWQVHGDPEKMLRAPNGAGSITDGYLLVMKNGERKRQHHLVAEIVLGRPLKYPEVVHHVDEDRKNNINKNLVICNRAYHALLHMRMRALEACGNPDYRVCIHCGRHDDPNMMVPRNKGKVFAHAICAREDSTNRSRLRRLAA